MQQHAARRLHYDFRFEVGGVLRSWAVPKGPSLNPEDKRLAVSTEDHPLEYGDFEGVIPSGNYGAGSVIVWDHGRCVHEIEPEQGEDDGKLLFELFGYKLRGLFTLVRTTRDPKEWLLIKKPDRGATGETVEDLGPESVLSGLTVDQLATGHKHSQRLRDLLDGHDLPKLVDGGDTVRPMLAKLERQPFSRKGWVFEIKYDGYRLLAEKRATTNRSTEKQSHQTVLADSTISLSYRSGLDVTAVYPELCRCLNALPFRSLKIDGEVTVLDPLGRPKFAALQRRAGLHRRIDVERATVATPVAMFAFDLLELEGYDLRRLPLLERKEILRQLLPPVGAIRYADHLEEHGEQFFEQVLKMGLEGVVAKRAKSMYQSGRGSDWIKIRTDREEDFVVVGFTQPDSGRNGFGGLHLAIFDGDVLRYAGRVGTGFSGRQLLEIRATLDALVVSERRFVGSPEKPRQSRWVDTRLVATIRYAEFTAGDQLRHPVFVRLRQDRFPTDCQRQRQEPIVSSDSEKERTLREAPTVQITRPAKIFWPDEGYTKGDLIAYYRHVSPWLLPYLKDRPLVLDRYPDGISGKSFFQKNAPEFAPDWVRTETVWSSDTERETAFFICNDENTLIYLINSGAIPLHLWSSRIGSLERPDWSIVDLDAKQATFQQVVTVARAVYRLAKRIGLESFVKTSGATGLHVLIPLGGQCTYEQSKQLAELMARRVVDELPEIASVVRTPRLREGKVYVDFGQNGYGKLLVSPFTVRPLAGAPVSTPLRWGEVTRKLDKSRFDINSVPRRLKRAKSEPLRGVLDARPDLVRALEQLATEIG